MQKLTLLFIYGQDEERRLRYRVTDDMPVGVMIEKLIGFQFVIDSADPKTFRVMHNGAEITDLTQTFEQSSVADGDEIYLIPTVFEPIPPLPENDAPIKRQRNDRRPQKKRVPENEDGPKKETMRKPGSYPNQRRRRPEHSSNKPALQEKPQTQNQTEQKKDGAPVPFKPKSRNYHRSHSRKPQN